MGTTEIIIVFSALMALIALVTIGIDWIGKPLKNRRFIPRMYRFDDEKLPVDAYGNTTLTPTDHTPVPQMAAYSPSPTARPGYSQPAPVVVARVAGVAGTPPPSAPVSPGSRSAFSDSLSESSRPPAIDQEPIGQGWLATGSVASTEPAPDASWSVGLALDTSSDGDKPNLATKSERFWITTAATLAESHFDVDDIDRMASGKAPRRTNPRTGRVEAMQLTGLRQASHPAEVQMSWPGDSIDPWNQT